MPPAGGSQVWREQVPCLGKQPRGPRDIARFVLRPDTPAWPSWRPSNAQYVYYERFRVFDLLSSCVHCFSSFCWQIWPFWGLARACSGRRPAKTGVRRGACPSGSRTLSRSVPPCQRSRHRLRSNQSSASRASPSSTGVASHSTDSRAWPRSACARSSVRHTSPSTSGQPPPLQKTSGACPYRASPSRH